MTVKFNSDDVLSSNKTIEPDNIIILIRSVFHEGNKYYPHVIDVSEGIDLMGKLRQIIVLFVTIGIF